MSYIDVRDEGCFEEAFFDLEKKGLRRGPLRRALNEEALFGGLQKLEAVCCSVLQCVAVCCSVLQCVAECVAVYLSSLEAFQSWRRGLQWPLRWRPSRVQSKGEGEGERERESNRL